MIIQGRSSFVFVIQNGSLYDFKSRLIRSYSILDDVFDLTIALYIGNNTYWLYEKDAKAGRNIKLSNIWRNGNIFLAKSIFPEARLQNLRGKKIRATSFEYPPFIYKEDQKYQGYEVQILEDLAQAVNFTYEIHNPSDGLLWGSILPNGTPTGLIRDMKVSD